MHSHIKLHALLLASLLLGGCFGTPHLLKPLPANPAKPSPSIDDVKDEITCELVKFKHDQKLKGGRFQGKYIVTATLLLQVDDYLDVTPTLNIIAPLIPSPDKRTVIASADIGGQREQTYTETFYVDSSRIDADADPNIACAPNAGDKRLQTDRFSLTGDLLLGEIIDNGERSLDSFSRYAPEKPGPNSNPSFGSTVEFIVTRSVSALGVQWEMGRFKGPSGNNGVINGKRVKTDKLIITFTKVLPDKPSGTANLTDAINKLRAAYERGLAAQQNLGKAQAASDASTRQFTFLSRVLADKRHGPNLAIRSQLSLARTELDRTTGDLNKARTDVAAANAEVANAQTVAAVAATTTINATAANNFDDAARSNALLQQTMILQSLNIQPR